MISEIGTYVFEAEARSLEVDYLSLQDTIEHVPVDWMSRKPLCQTLSFHIILSSLRYKRGTRSLAHNLTIQVYIIECKWTVLCTF